MKNKTIIFLSVLIALMLGIIVSAVIYLYSTPKAVVEATAAGQSGDAVSQVAGSKLETTETEEEAVQSTEASAEVSSEASKAEPDAQAKKASDPAPAASAVKPAQTESAAKPAPSEFQVKNSNTGKMNTLRQNADNSLALIDHNRKQLWKISFPGKIVGEPAQIDIYNNLKIQYLIAEGSKLHLIDRLGREVKKFPLALPGTAKSGPKDVKKDKLVYWQIETAAGTVYFDKQNVKILNQLP